eukprot:GHVS01034994.1.p1 GENE.GHVS01034994.1~~GHVS01034994.1.p1  ORF type:complete len:422 (+),score=44.73 GHVS01034994.1:183-1448(+)
MELDVGAHCSKADCHKLDFLPFLCAHCNQLFCLTHRTPSSHQCSASHASDTGVRGGTAPISHSVKADNLAFSSSCRIQPEPQGALVVCSICHVACVLVSDTMEQEEVERRLAEHRLTAECHMMRSKGQQCQMRGGCFTGISVKKKILEEGSQGMDSSKGDQGRTKCMNPSTRMLCLCSACQSYYCLAHRHPEDHHCPSLDAVKKPRGVAASGAQKNPRIEGREVEEAHNELVGIDRCLRMAIGTKSEYKNEEARRMAQQVRRIKIKMRARGDQSVSTGDRICVSVVLDPAAVQTLGCEKKTGSGGSSASSLRRNGTEFEDDIFVWIDKSKNMQCAKESVCKLAKVTNPGASRRIPSGDMDDKGGARKLVLWRRVPVDVCSRTTSTSSSVGTEYSWECPTGGNLAGNSLVEGDLLVLTDSKF